MKYDSQIDRRRLLRVSMRAMLTLVVVGALVVPIAVQADLKATAVVYDWDMEANKFQNSNVNHSLGWHLDPIPARAQL